VFYKTFLNRRGLYQACLREFSADAICGIGSNLAGLLVVYHKNNTMIYRINRGYSKTLPENVLSSGRDFNHTLGLLTLWTTNGYMCLVEPNKTRNSITAIMQTLWDASKEVSKTTRNTGVTRHTLGYLTQGDKKDIKIPFLQPEEEYTASLRDALQGHPSETWLQGCNKSAH
jgi:hypothetical protein